MAGGAVALARLVEERQAAQLLRVERRPAAQEVVVAAAERMERRVLELEALQGEREAPEGAVDVVEHRRAEDGAELPGVGRARQPGHHLGPARVGHLDRVEQRLPGLVGERGGAAVPEEAADRRAVGLDVEGGVALQVADRHRLPDALAVESRPARLRGEGVRRAVRGGGVVAARARLAPRGRQRRVVVDALAEPGDGRKRRGVGQAGGGDAFRRAAPAAATAGEQRGGEPRGEPGAGGGEAAREGGTAGRGTVGTIGAVGHGSGGGATGGRSRGQDTGRRATRRRLSAPPGAGRRAAPSARRRRRAPSRAPGARSRARSSRGRSR